MSRRYFRVGPSIWLEPWSEDARYLALYLLTCQHRVTEGIYRLPIAYALADLKWTEQRFRQGLGELLSEGFAEYDFDAQVCLLPKALAWQAPENPNQVVAAVSKIADLPKTPLLARFLTVAETLSERLAQALHERFPEGFGEPLALTPPLEQHPPNPPQAGGTTAGLELDSAKERLQILPPVKPAGNRGREHDAYQEQFAAWVDAHFPGCKPSAVEHIVGWVQSRGDDPTPTALREFADAAPNFTHLLEPAA